MAELDFNSRSFLTFPPWAALLSTWVLGERRPVTKADGGAVLVLHVQHWLLILPLTSNQSLHVSGSVRIHAPGVGDNCLSPKVFMSIKGSHWCECVFHIWNAGEFPLLAQNTTPWNLKAAIPPPPPGIGGIILLSAKYFTLSILDGTFPIMSYTLYWSFKHNTINVIWSGWLTGIKKINFYRTIPGDLLRHARTLVSPLTGSEWLWLWWLLMPPLNEFVQPSLLFLTGISLLPIRRLPGLSLLNYFFCLAMDQLKS